MRLYARSQGTGLVTPFTSMRVSFIALLIFVSVSCSSKKGQEAVIPPSSPQIFDKESAKMVLDTSEVTCPEGNCVESVGAFYMYHAKKSNGAIAGYEIKLCSATLIETNKILTNRHCIEDVIKAGESFSNEIFANIKFPKANGKPFASYKLKKVLSTSDEYFTNEKNTTKVKRKRQVPDWAVLEITEHIKDRSPVTASDASFDAANAGVVLYPVFFDMQSKDLKGVLKKVSCTRELAIATPYIFATSADGPLLTMSTCSHHLISGNSGSGVFTADSSGLVGIVATAMNDHASGAVVQCVPELNPSNSSQCIFPNEQEFIDAMKTTAYVERVLRNVLLNPDIADMRSEKFEYHEKSGRAAYRQVSTELASFWSKPATYLRVQGSETFADNYRLAFTKLLLPHVPKCYVQELQDKVEMQIGDLESWKVIFDYQWTEYIITDEQGREISMSQELSIPSAYFRSRPVSFSVNKDKKIFVLKAEATDLPEPFQSLEIRIPPCH